LDSFPRRFLWEAWITIWSRALDKCQKVLKISSKFYLIVVISVSYINCNKEVLGMKIQPLNDRVLVRRIEEEQKTSGGIIIPDTAKEKPQEGKVIAAGPGKLDDKGKRMPLDVKKGDRVLFGKYAGNDIQIDGVEHLIMREDDILAILEK
jgi:chaperonin GroES